MLGVREAEASGPSARGRKPAPPPGKAEATAERLKAIIREATTPEDALEPSLRWIVEAMGGAGGAICFFDQRKELLRLAAECNLSDEGCRRLRSVRRGDVAGWDMPLHGLLNRRAYLIDSAAKNRYVPPLIEGPSLVRSVVCLPVYQGNNPLGSLLVVATGARMLTERDIRDLEPSLRELAALVEAIRLRAPTVTPSARAATVTPIAAGPTGDPEAPRGRPAVVDPDHADSASSVLMEVIDLRAKVHELKAQLASAEAAAQEESTRAAALETKLRKDTAELEAKVRQAAAALDTAQARERVLKEQLGDAHREDLPTRLAEVQARAEEQAKRASDLEARLAETAATGEATLKAERARLAEVETRAAGRQQALEKLTAAAEELKARLASAEASLAAEKARAAERASHAATGSLATEELTATVAELKARLAATETRLASAEASLAAEKARADEAAGRLEAATANDQEYADAEVAAVRTVVERLRAELAEQRAHIERLEPAAHGAESLDRELRATREREMELRKQVAALEAEVGEHGTSPAPAAAGPAPAAEAPAAESAAPGVVVVDTGGGWARLRGVRVEAPDDGLAGRLDATPGRILVNLAAPGALRALAQLRAAGSTRRFWGCLATPDAARALPLGMVEPAVRPLAPETLVEVLVSYAARGTRVVTLGRDIDAFGGFRESMARQGLSVSMAWDAKQAADVIAMVRPEVAVVDLDSLREGCAIIAGLAGAEPLPHFVLLFGAKDPAAGFAHAVRDPAHASRALPFDRLVAELARRSEGRPAERK